MKDRQETRSLMPSGEPAADHFSPDEIRAAFQELSQAAWIRLHKVAKARCWHGLLDPDDLLQTALTRALEGSRPCPRRVAVIPFLAQTMRSIASGRLKAERQRPELRLVTAPNEDGELPFDPPDPRPTAEEGLADEQEISRIKAEVLALFDDDLIAQTIVEGVMEEMEAEELRSLTGLDKTAYASKRRLIRRRIERAFPKGW